VVKLVCVLSVTVCPSIRVVFVEVVEIRGGASYVVVSTTTSVGIPL
jgi:hypothetical protein